MQPNYTSVGCHVCVLPTKITNVATSDPTLCVLRSDLRNFFDSKSDYLNWKYLLFNPSLSYYRAPLNTH